MRDLLGWLAFVVLILGNALFVSAEFALTSVDRLAVARQARAGDKRAAAIRKATGTLSFQLSSVQFGITVCSLLLGFVAEPVFDDALRPLLHAVGLSESASRPVAGIVGLVVATLVQMLFGELVPQNLAITAPLGVGRVVIGPHRLFTRLAGPVVRLFDRAANGIVRFLGIEPQSEVQGARTPVEFRGMIASSAREGTLGGATAQLLSRGLFFGDRTAGEVMTPRTQVVSVLADATVADLIDVARRTGHSRFPVHRGDLDDVVGVVNIGVAMGVPRARRSSVRVAHLVVEPERVPEQLDLDGLLRRLGAARSQLALVIDEYGGTAGVVTLEDLLEELVGQVRDEYDEAETPEVRRRDGDPGGWDLSGQVHTDELAELLRVATPRGPFDTAGGLIMDRLGRLPEVGDTVDYEGWELTVETMDGRRVDRVLARRRDDLA
ncbi:MAG: hemolysin family protein [Jatrophihabitans sp.]|uniref:hemolysin family protein n=1 Tax=Jatrophihabitans sp. TaxID=1932789 RepID=UPI003F81BF59